MITRKTIYGGNKLTEECRIRANDCQYDKSRVAKIEKELYGGMDQLMISEGNESSKTCLFRVNKIAGP